MEETVLMSFLQDDDSKIELIISSQYLLKYINSIKCSLLKKHTINWYTLKVVRGGSYGNGKNAAERLYRHQTIGT